MDLLIGIGGVNRSSIWHSGQMARWSMGRKTMMIYTRNTSGAIRKSRKKQSIFRLALEKHVKYHEVWVSIAMTQAK